MYTGYQVWNRQCTDLHLTYMIDIALRGYLFTVAETHGENLAA